MDAQNGTSKPQRNVRWDDAVAEAEQAAARMRWVQTAGYLSALGIQVGYLHEQLPARGKTRRLFEHLAETLELLENEVRRKAMLPPADEEDFDV